jgi:uncharacterized protein (DUF2236 family)
VGRRTPSLDTRGRWPLRVPIRATLTRLFGPPPFDPAVGPGDPGLTGPDSASWRVIAEPAAIAGGVRGLVLQVAHPLAMAGVHDHSAYRSDPLGRLHRTSAYIGVTTYGSTPEVFEVLERVRRIHRHVRGTAPDGRHYDAAEPHLLAWVSIALTSSFLVADRCFSPLPAESAVADAFVAEQATFAALLDPRVDLEALRRDPTTWPALRRRELDLPMLAEGLLPRSVGELDTHLAAFAPELAVGDEGRDALRFLARPPLPLAARAGYRVLFDGAVASLTPAEQAALELEVDDPGRRLARARRLLGAMRALSGTAPSRRLATARVDARVRVAG